jgi:periplasmic protein TonB
MRIYTLVFSVIAHAIAIAWVIIAPALATNVLPEPRRTSAYIVVHPAPPDVPPEIPRGVPRQSRDAAPLDPPTELRPEPIVQPSDQPAFDVPASTIDGVASIGDVAGTDVIQAPPVPQPPRPVEPIPIGGVIRPPKKVFEVAPVYPTIALQARRPGLVILQAVIDERGDVREVKVLRSDPLFDEAARTAVRQWRFTPTLLNGQAVPVVMSVTVTFSVDR